MPIEKKRDKDGVYYQWGESGKKYYLSEHGEEKALKLAKNQAKAIYASGYEGNIEEDPDTPAPKEDRIKGSDKNPSGSAKDSKGNIKLSDEQEKGLKNIIDEFNKENPDKKVNLGQAKAVFRRAMGAYSYTHRPSASRSGWGYERVKAFLYIVKNGEPENPNYKQDNDLLPSWHKLKNNSEINDYFKIVNEAFEINSEEITNFPKSGDNLKISLRNSQYPQFDHDYAMKLKEEYPEIWEKGGNIFGNKAYEYWNRWLNGDESEEVLKWIKKREAFMARHLKDFRIAGVIAVIKWGGIVSRGEKYMKDLIEAEKKKIDKKRQKQEKNEVNQFNQVEIDGDFEIVDKTHEFVEDIQNKNTINTMIKTQNGFIEICEMSEDDLAGRTKIKMTAHEIYDNSNKWNKNGITWLKEYTEKNMKSAIGMPYVVSWLNEEYQIPSDHGTMSHDDEGNVQFDGVAVGTVQDAYIGEVEIDGELKTAFITEGYLFNQRYPKLIKFLKEQKENGNNIKGSIEINGKGKSKRIEYLDGDTNPDGTKKMGRIPTIYDYSGLAILYIEEPADDTSQILEINTKQGDKVELEDNKNNKTIENIETNRLNYEQIKDIVEKRFNQIMKPENWDKEYEYRDFYVEFTYPDKIILKRYHANYPVYSVEYTIEENNQINLKNIQLIEYDFKPVENIDSNINQQQNKGGNTDMENLEKMMAEKCSSCEKMKMYDEYSVKMGEYNAKITEYNMKMGEYNAKMDEKEKMMAEMHSKMEEMNTKMAEMCAKDAEKDAKMAEMNEAIVNASKMKEELNSKMKMMEEELNGYKGKYEAMMTEKNKVEVNSYFENEVKKNGFTEAELNSLKDYVEKIDLVGLKQAEAELCTKKFKEITSQKQTVEANTFKNTDLFFPTKVEEKEVNDVEAGKQLF